MIFLRYNITHALYIEEKKECNIIHSPTMITSTAQICYLKYPIVPSTPSQVLWDATVMLLRAQHGNQKMTYHYRLGAPREHTNTHRPHIPYHASKCHILLYQILPIHCQSIEPSTRPTRPHCMVGVINIGYFITQHNSKSNDNESANSERGNS